MPALAVVACVLVLTAIGRSRTSPGTTERPADREASSFADTYLLTRLTAAADAATRNDDPAARVEHALQALTGEPVPGSHETVLVGVRNGDSFPVAVYSFWHDKSFSGGAPYWGRACRVYTVDHSTITARRADCPASVPDVPAGQVLSDEGWFQD